MRRWSVRAVPLLVPTAVALARRAPFAAVRSLPAFPQLRKAEPAATPLRRRPVSGRCGLGLP